MYTNWLLSRKKCGKHKNARICLVHILVLKIHTIWHTARIHVKISCASMIDNFDRCVFVEKYDKRTKAKQNTYSKHILFILEELYSFDLVFFLLSWTSLSAILNNLHQATKRCQIRCLIEIDAIQCAIVCAIKCVFFLVKSLFGNEC